MCARAALGYVADIEMYTVTCLLLKSLQFMATYGKKVYKVVPQDRIYIYIYYCSDNCIEEMAEPSPCSFTGQQLRLWQSTRYSFQKHREAVFSWALGGKVLRLLLLVRRLILVGFQPVKTFYCICAITRNKISKKHFRMYLFFFLIWVSWGLILNCCVTLGMVKSALQKKRFHVVKKIMSMVGHRWAWKIEKTFRPLISLFI